MAKSLWSSLQPHLKNLSPTDLADHADRARTTLGRWIDGSVVPSIDDAEAVLGVVGVRLTAEIVLPDPYLRVAFADSFAIQRPVRILERMGPSGVERCSQPWPADRRQAVKLLRGWQAEGYKRVHLAITNRYNADLRHDYSLAELLDTDWLPIRSLGQHVRVVIEEPSHA